MKAGELRRLLEGVAGDSWDEDRDYLGMSRIWECPRRLYRALVRGRRRPGPQGLRYCHEGMLHEKDVVERLVSAGVEVVNCQRELVAEWDVRFKGHIDGEIEGELLEIKSVSERRFEEVRNRPDGRHLDQCQMYMLFGGYEKGMIVYKCRENGLMWVVPVTRKEDVGERLVRKARMVLEAVDVGEAPECSCGRC